MAELEFCKGNYKIIVRGVSVYYSHFSSVELHEYNPITDKALITDNIVKYRACVRFTGEYAVVECGYFDEITLRYEGYGLSKELGEALCLAILKSKGVEI